MRVGLRYRSAMAMVTRKDESIGDGIGIIGYEKINWWTWDRL
jgi:hypothetical protein